MSTTPASYFFAAKFILSFINKSGELCYRCRAPAVQCYNADMRRRADRSQVRKCPSSTEDGLGDWRQRSVGQHHGHPRRTWLLVPSGTAAVDLCIIIIIIIIINIFNVA